jgi:sporulation and spore germination protein
MTQRSLIIALAILLAASFAMGAYAWHMRRTVMPETPVKEAEPVAPPVSGPAEQVTLYMAYDSPGTLLPESISTPLPQDRQLRAESLLHALISRYLEKSSTHPLAPGSDVRDVYLVEPGLAVVDLNADMANGHRSGILVEELTLASIAQTLTTNVSGITRIKFLVDGKERETLAGHADLMDFYDTNEIDQLMGALQPPQ